MRRHSLVVFVPEEIEINRLPVGNISIPVIAASREGDGFVTSVSVSAFGRTCEATTASPLTALHLRPEEVRAGLDRGDLETTNLISEHGAFQPLELDVHGIPMDDGTGSFATIEVRAIVSGREAMEIIRVPLQVTSLPNVPGWYGGDGHVHTVWSPDVVLLPISQRARHARDNGFGFIIIADHEDGIGRKWGMSGGYCDQCRAAEDEYGLPVLPGVEIAVANGGHCLAYHMKETAGTVPSNRGFDSRRLLAQIDGHNRPLSYGIAAHPYERREKWTDWSVRNLAGLEIINRSRRARPEAVSKWFELLNRGLARTLKTGSFTVGLANSDCHNLQEPGGRGFTWIRPGQREYARETATSGPLTRESVWSAIRSGRAVASGSKDLGFFTLNGAGIGETVTAYPGSTLALALEHHPSAGRRCRKITVFSGDGRQTVLTPGRPGMPLRLETRCPRSSTFYLAKFDFTGHRRHRDSEVWTNPVFVRVAG
ncbi:MAG TPA: hypothetical protein GX716_10090 [Firmicutes bacterium]|nr:hypothetical protein [Candidatus Fermentithermobacillaceae bacterium]